jgi:hypothetical protein
MLFMATHTAAPETSIIRDSDRYIAFQQVLSNAGKTGVIMRGMYVNAPAQIVYFLFEADNADQIADIFKPILDFGHIESVPVVDRLAL